MNDNIIDLARRLKLQFLDQSQALDQISIFLCGGGDAAQANFRRALGKHLSNIVSKYSYRVYYPEDMFVELILGHKRYDLLTLENLLARNVHCVVILLESPGTLTELGAFANHDGLKDKLVIVLDPKYKKHPSFIVRGPIRYLKTNTYSKILYSVMDENNLVVLAPQLARATRDIGTRSPPEKDLLNPISSYNFYLALAYVFDPIPRDYVLQLVKSLGIGEDQVSTAEIVAETVINTLISERKIACSSGMLSVTTKGVGDLIASAGNKKKSSTLSQVLCSLRIEALNLTLRRSYNTRQKVWVG